MIRDPSDGSVKEKPEPVIPVAKNHIVDANGMVSGLPITNHKAEYLARLEKSREWLKNWFNQNPA